MFNKKKSSKYEMNTAAADTALQNILEACNKTPVSIPFNKILLQQETNTKFYKKITIVLAIILLITFLLPLGIVPAASWMSQFNTPEPVNVVNDYVEEGYLYLTLTGDNIMYSEAYIETIDGEIIPVTSYNKKTGVICFPYRDDTESNIYIPVRNSRTVHLLLSPIN